jgi:hypothetical protein
VQSRAKSRIATSMQKLAEEILARHSRERAADAANDLPEPPAETANEDMDAWSRVLAELPEDDPPARTSTGNGHDHSRFDRRGWDLD